MSTPTAARPDGPLEDVLFQTTGVGACVLDADGRVVQVNAAFARFFAVSASRLAGMPRTELFREHLAKRLESPETLVRCLEARHAVGDPVPSLELHVLGDDEVEERWLEFRSDPVVEGRYRGYRSETYTDISGRRSEFAAALRRLTRVFKVGSPALVLLDRDLRIVDPTQLGEANAMNEFGRKVERGRLVTDYLPEEDRDEIAGYIARAFAGETVRVEREIAILGGEPQWWDVAHIPVPGEDGQVEYVCLRTHSAAPKRQAQLALERGAALLRRIIDQVPSRISMRDAEGRVLLANRATAEALDTTVEALMSGEHGPLPLSAAERALLESGERSEREEELSDGSGRQRTLLTAQIPLSGTEGTERILLTASLDITEAKRARAERSQRLQLEREVAERTADLKRVNRELRRLQSRLFKAERLSAAEEIAGAVAHSIHNPLTALLGTVQMELDAPRSPDPERALERVLQLGGRIRDVVDGTLKLYRRGTLDLAPACPSELLVEVRDALRTRWPERVAQIELEARAGIPSILVDRTLLVSSLTALAENAFEAMEPGGKLLLQAEHLSSAGVLRFRVSDTGPGIPLRLREQAFEPFFTTKGAGTGLGLAIARGVVQGHGGRILIEDRPGGGAVVSIEIPDGLQS